MSAQAHEQISSGAGATTESPTAKLPPTEKRRPDEPALYITTQTTIPILTTLMFTFAVAMIGVIASGKWPISVLPLSPSYQVNTRDVAYVLIGVSALLFIFATEACVRSHAWDYFAISDEHRKFSNISEDEGYKHDCSYHSRVWHAFAALAYTFGLILIMCGIGVLFLRVSYIISILSFSYASIETLFFILWKTSPDWMKNCRDWLWSWIVDPKE
jgi:hypothetical protein